MSVGLPRQIAYDCFAEVMYHQRKADSSLEQAFRKYQNELSRLDKNFIKEILYGSLRWYYKIYWILNQTCKRDLGSCDEYVRSSLICGTYQIYYMDRVPDRASVNESVEYVKEKGISKASSFVNGILRQIARKSQYFPKPDKDNKFIEYLSVQYSHPAWMIDRWLNVDELKKGVVEKILAANNKQPSVFVRVSPINSPNVTEFQNLLLKTEKTFSSRENLSNCLRLKNSPRLDEGSLFSKGYYTIQNLSSQLVGSIASFRGASLIVDACSGPGGKLSYLYESLPESKIIAVERSDSQYERMISTMQRLGYDTGRVSFIKSDFLDYKPENQCDLPDKILLDAPCSGLGVLASHPEGKWQKSENIVETMSLIQQKLLSHALSILKVGGELIFSVCSFEKEESLDHLSYLKEKFGTKISFLSIEDRVSDYFKKFITDKILLRIFPNEQDEMDGFCCFVVKKLDSIDDIEVK